MISFAPLYKTRVWGGRSLESRYRRQLPDSQPYGEAWELTDRAAPEEQSVVTAPDPWKGRILHDLWTRHRQEIFGEAYVSHPSARFPILVKILDARDDLSVQVHPPAAIAPGLGGEPKTEMWYIARADPGAKLYIGLKNGTTADMFRRAIGTGEIGRASCRERVCMFV